MGRFRALAVQVLSHVNNKNKRETKEKQRKGNTSPEHELFWEMAEKSHRKQAIAGATKFGETGGL